jgi:hypothetical protein
VTVGRAVAAIIRPVRSVGSRATATRVDDPDAATTEASPPIFVVGVGRSGTTLLASMLGAHPRLDCGPESRFFFGLERTSERRILDDPDWPSEAVRFIGSLVTNAQPTHEFFGIDLDAVRRYLRDRSPSVPAILESLTVQHARRAGKPRWVEKTTDHLVHVDRIRQHWPDARIIRIVRDPRDVALSLRFVPWGSPSVIANLYFWADRDARSADFFERDGGSLTVRYEDLLRDPRDVLARICDHVGESFDEAMLSTGESARLVAGAGESWKAKARTAVDPTRLEVWRRELTESQRTVASVVCSDGLARYGYPDAARVALRVAFQPLVRESIEAHEELIARLASDGIRLAPWPPAVPDAPPDRLPHVVCAWGRPGQLRWRWRAHRVARVRAVARLVAALWSRRRRVLWIDEDNGLPRRGGMADRPADIALRLLARRVSRERAVTLLSDLAARAGRVPDGGAASDALAPPPG